MIGSTDIAIGAVDLPKGKLRAGSEGSLPAPACSEAIISALCGQGEEPLIAIPAVGSVAPELARVCCLHASCNCRDTEICFADFAVWLVSI